MRIFTIFIISTLFLSNGYGQSETNNFTTYDTTYIYRYDPWHTFNCYMRISRPVNLFTPGSPDTASRPVFIMMPGQGEMNSNPASLVAWGPHYFLNQGSWDGSVKIGNGTHYPILITMTWDVSPPQPPVSGVAEVLSYLIRNYHINRKNVALTGLSEGSFTFCGVLGIDVITDSVQKMVTSIAMLSGAATNTGNWAYFGHWAKKYNGKAFLTVGYGDAQITFPPLLAQNMNDSVPGSAYFTYNTIANGGHNLWNVDYDPTVTNWQATPPYGTYVTTNSQPNSSGTYKAPSSIFQWMLRQGDTTLVVSKTSGGGSTTVTGPCPVCPTCPTCPAPVVCPVCPAIPPPRTVVSITYTLVNGVWVQKIQFSDGSSQ